MVKCIIEIINKKSKLNLQQLFQINNTLRNCSVPSGLTMNLFSGITPPVFSSNYALMLTFSSRSSFLLLKEQVYSIFEDVLEPCYN